MQTITTTAPVAVDSVLPAVVRVPGLSRDLVAFMALYSASMFNTAEIKAASELLATRKHTAIAGACARLTKAGVLVRCMPGSYAISIAYMRRLDTIGETLPRLRPVRRS